MKNTQSPRLVHMANLWSLVDYPNAKKEWPLARKLEAVREAGFTCITTCLTEEHARHCQDLGLEVVGFFSSAKIKDFRPMIRQQKDNGARFINVQLGDHDTTTEAATKLTLRLMEESRKQEVECSVEIHRDTCTETPEKAWALADAYQKETGELLPMTLDFSHISTVKHLFPPYSDRLLERPNLVQRARQVHFRPFNGHHCQVPVTDGKGKLTREVRECLPFAEDLFRMWLQGKGERDCLYVCPEMGPARSGYNFDCLPNSWEDAKRLRPLLEKAWQAARKSISA